MLTSVLVIQARTKVSKKSPFHDGKGHKEKMQEANSSRQKYIDKMTVNRPLNRPYLIESPGDKIIVILIMTTIFTLFNLQDLMSSSPYCLPYSSFNVSFKNLVLDQSIIPQLIFFFILITCLVDIVLTMQGEILSWSLMGVKVLNECEV